MSQYKMTIIGQIPAKANSYQIIRIAGHPSIKKTKAIEEYEKSFYLQCPCRGKDIKGFFKVEIDIFFKSLSSDIDNAAKGILDCLQSCKVIHNDNHCLELHMRKFKDVANPRAEITITEIDL